MTKEASVVINGEKLNTAQSLVLRVSIGMFLEELLNEKDWINYDEVGKSIREKYINRLKEVLELISRGVE